MKAEQKQAIHFALCLNNKGYEASLEVEKLYRIIKVHGLIRVIDESGEDYAFSANRFYPMQLPQNVEETLLAAS